MTNSSDRFLAVWEAAWVSLLMGISRREGQGTWERNEQGAQHGRETADGSGLPAVIHLSFLWILELLPSLH